MKRLLTAGTHSGCGKTTVTCGLLAALKERGLRVSAFKCGPDYIDPMFHREVTGIPSYNLDSFFCDDDMLRYLLHENAAGSDIAVIEGVMGYYDGVNGRGSAYSVAVLTDTPAVLIIDCTGMSDSIGAVLRGFIGYRSPDSIAGVIFNKLPERLLPLAERLCGELGTRCFGYFPKSSVTIESRHLGLVTAAEIDGIRGKLRTLGELAEKCIDIDALLQLPEREIPAYKTPVFQPVSDPKPVIAVARDRAFCFIYADNVELLKKLGCEIRYFSPVTDRKLPENAAGLILCGGYPELYAAELSANTEMQADIKAKIMSGMPVIAECGGFMYLHDSFGDMEGGVFRGVRAIRGRAYLTEKLQRFGYVTLTAKKDGLLCSAGESFPAHEFHRFDSTDCGCDMTAVKADGRSWDCVHMTDSVYAGFPHLYFYADIGIARRFADKCREYMEKKNGDKSVSAG